MRIVEEECVATIGIFRQNGKRLGYQAIGSGPLNNPEWPTVLWWLQDCRQVDPRLPIEPGILMHVHSLGGRDLDAPILLSQPIAKRFLANFRAAARVAFNHPIWLSASLAWQERERRPFDSDLTRAHIWLPDSPQIVVPARAESSSRSLLLLAQVLSRRRRNLRPCRHTNLRTSLVSCWNAQDGRLRLRVRLVMEALTLLAPQMIPI